MRQTWWNLGGTSNTVTSRCVSAADVLLHMNVCLYSSPPAAQTNHNQMVQRIYGACFSRVLTCSHLAAHPSTCTTSGWWFHQNLKMFLEGRQQCEVIVFIFAMGRAAHFT